MRLAFWLPITLLPFFPPTTRRTSTIPLYSAQSHPPSHLCPHRSHPAKRQPTPALLLQIPVSAFHPGVIAMLPLHSQNLLWEIDPRQEVWRSRKSACVDPGPHDLKKSHLWAGRMGQRERTVVSKPEGPRWILTKHMIIRENGVLQGVL